VAGAAMISNRAAAGGKYLGMVCSVMCLMADNA
jgi:hypothetical protein